MKNNTSRVALVTGASSGMGQVIARAFARHGISVVGADIQPFSEPEANGLKFMPLDLAQPDQCRKVVQAVVETEGRLDILVNCGGVGMNPASPAQDLRAALHEADLSGYLAILNINLLGASCLAHDAAIAMVQGGWGRIINITTSFDTMLAQGLSAYGASKAALEASTASWAKDLAGTGVTCNTLIPGGPTDTNFFPREMNRPPALLPPEIMAPPALWLISEAAASINGARVVANEWQPAGSTEPALAGVYPAAWPELASQSAQRRGHAV